MPEEEDGGSCPSLHNFDDKYDSGDTMIMLSEKGKLGDASFKETHRQKILDGLCWAKPVLLDNYLYARDAEGTVACFRLQ